MYIKGGACGVITDPSQIVSIFWYQFKRDDAVIETNATLWWFSLFILPKKVISILLYLDSTIISIQNLRSAYFLAMSSRIRKIYSVFLVYFRIFNFLDIVFNGFLRVTLDQVFSILPNLQLFKDKIIYIPLLDESRRIKICRCNVVSFIQSSS